MSKEIKKSLIKNFAKKLIIWQRGDGRHNLPWQLDRTAYRVWLSEIMLQQTQVSTVLLRYQAFLKRFPDLSALALASVDEVLSEWSGMGYYTRARNLHKCARVVMAEYGGIFPSDPAELEKLPGIGRSTAAAIAVFAYGRQAAILDGNVKRVLARIWGVEADLSKLSETNKLWAHAESLLPSGSDEMIAYTQGLMDFGATFCTQNSPLCLSQNSPPCPYVDACEAKAKNKILQIPLKVKKIKVAQMDLVWWVLVYKDQVLLEKRPHQGIWAGLWAFPERFNIRATDNPIPMDKINHVLTHRRLAIEPIKIQLKNQKIPIEASQQWFDLNDALLLGLPKPVKTVLLSLTQAHGAV
jgi:A/G-specific adenine glycosylase